MLEILRNCFTWKGRLDRADFCAGMLGLVIPVTAFMGATWAAIFFHKNPVFLPIPAFFLLFFFIWLLGLFIELSLFIRRFHDIGRPGTHVFYMLIPFANIYFMALLFFAKSVENSPEAKGNS
jgi:uncharacterized membrane protein YhaH (DUF805 family)